MTDASYLDLLAETMDLVVAQVGDAVAAGKTLGETRSAMDWSGVHERFTDDDGVLALIFDIWFKSPIVEAQYNLATGKDNESLEAIPRRSTELNQQPFTLTASKRRG